MLSILDTVAVEVVLLCYLLPTPRSTSESPVTTIRGLPLQSFVRVSGVITRRSEYEERFGLPKTGPISSVPLAISTAAKGLSFTTV